MLKLMVDRALLTDALQTVARATKADNAYAILANVLLSAEDGTLTLTAFDQEIGITEEIRASIEQAGKTTAPARMLMELLSKSSEEKVALELSEDGKKLKVSCGGTNVSLYTLPAEHYHLPPELPDGAGCEIKRATLKDIIARVAFCADPANKVPTKAFLGGAHFSGRGSKLEIEATDGYRIAFYDVLDAEITGDFDIIVPHKAMMEMIRILGDNEANTIISVTENLLQMKVDDVVFVTRLIAGDFPAIPRRHLANRQASCVITASTKAMKGIIGRIAVIAGSTDKANGVDFALSGNRLTLHSVNEMAGDITESMEVVVKYNDPPEEAPVGWVTPDWDDPIWECNCGHIADVVGSCDGEMVELSIGVKTKPIVVSDPEDETVKYMVFPMNPTAG